MKKVIVFFCCFFALKTLAQEIKDYSILTNTKNWKKEIIKFPIDWAPDVKLVGFEELRFAPNWNKQNHKEFWTLVMAWSIDAKSALSQNLITTNFKGYFDGLMKPNHWSQTFAEPKIKVFEKNKNDTDFTFQMTFFDGFHTGKITTVNVKVTQIFCRITQRAFITFYISPQKQKDKIWKTLKKMKLLMKTC